MSVKDKVLDAGKAVGDTAKSVGHKIADGAEQATDWVKDKAGMAVEGKDVGVAGIKERMDVIASCGKKIGVVDHINDGVIKLTQKDSPDGMHHFIPVGWVERVDGHVHLKKNSMEAIQGWKADATGCGCGS